MSAATRLAWYRLRTTGRGRIGGYVSIVALTGLIGGAAIGSFAAARRTSSSYSTFLASTHPSDLALGTGLLNPGLGYLSGYNPTLVHQIAALPHVVRAESYAAITAYPLGADGAPLPAAMNANFAPLGSVDGQYFDQDRVTAVRGRRPDPGRRDEFAVTAQLANELGLRLGEAVRFGVYTPEQSAAAGFGTAAVAPHATVTARLVGIVVFNHAVVQDDLDASDSQYLLFTPAFTRPFAACCSNFAFTALKLQHGPRDVAAVESEIARVFPPRLPFDPRATSVVRTKTQRAIQPAAVALAVFGAVIAVAGLVIVAQAIDRQVRAAGLDSEALRALGAGPGAIAADHLVGLLAAIVTGSAVAAAVAIGLSPLAPLGPVRALYPGPAVAVDWVAVGGGCGLLLASLASVAAAVTWRRAPHRLTASAPRRSALPRLAGHLPVGPATGIRFALDPGEGANAVPVRSAVLGAAVAFTVAVGVVTFGSSLGDLVSHPALYGWSWDYALIGGGGAGAVPDAAASRLLAADGDVRAWSPVYFANLRIDGQSVSVLGAEPGSAVAPPILSGHGFEGTDQIVLGTSTLAMLHKHVGDTVSVGYGTAKPTMLRVVGTASLPALGIGGVDVNHLSMSTGAVVSSGLIPESVRNSFGNTPAGPNAILVRLRAGVPAARASQGLQQMATQLTLPTNYGVAVLGVQRPAEIVNYRSMRATPALLALGLGAGAVAGLGLTLFATVRRRRKDLAVLKVLGFTRRQLGAAIACQASVAVVAGAIVGVPLGIAAGRYLWDAFARAIGVVPAPQVPALAIIAIAGGGLALANIVALVPARAATRVPAGLVLRAE